MFIGEYSHTIDTKGRLIIPAKFREELGEQCVIGKGFDNCLTIYTTDDFERISSTLARQPINKTGVRALKRLILGSAIEEEFDRQGRVLVSAALREHAGLKKEVVLIGQGNTIEIWSRERWEEYHTEVIDTNIEAIAENMDDLDLF